MVISPGDIKTGVEQISEHVNNSRSDVAQSVDVTKVGDVTKTESVTDDVTLSGDVTLSDEDTCEVI